jgi:hypothetical protein
MKYPATLNHDVGIRNRSVLTLQQVEEDVIDRIERAFAAAMRANTTPVCLEVTRAQYDELSRQYGVPDGIRMYRGRPVVIASEFRWVTQ